MIHYLIADSDWVGHSGFLHLPFAFFGILHGGFWTRLELELLASLYKEPIAHESLHLDTKIGLISGKNSENRWKLGKNWYNYCTWVVSNARSRACSCCALKAVLLLLCFLCPLIEPYLASKIASKSIWIKFPKNMHFHAEM